MIVQPENPILKQTLDNLLKKDFEISELVHDYDGTVYLVEGRQDCVRVSLQCACPGAIYANGGQEMLEEVYPEFLVDKADIADGFDLTLSINTADMPKTQKVSKSMGEEEQKAVREQNELTRIERQELCDKITTRISKIKRDFLGAPIRKAIKEIAEGKEVTACEIPYRPFEKYWIVSPKADQMTIIFSVHFELEADQALARVMLLEFPGAMRKVQQPVQVRFFDKELPVQLQHTNFAVDPSAYSNGFITMQYEGKVHLKNKDMEQMLTFTTGFRQYIHYHLHGIKSTLHKQMRKKVELFERVIVKAKRDEVGPKNWKEQKIGQSNADRELGEEEKKQEEVVQFK